MAMFKKVICIFFIFMKLKLKYIRLDKKIEKGLRKVKS